MPGAASSKTSATRDSTQVTNAVPTGRDFKPWVLIALVALLPFGALAELPVLVAVMWTMVAWRRIAWRSPGVRLALALFAAYWLPELWSAPDSFDARRSWIEVVADLRYAGVLVFATYALRAAAGVRVACTGVAIVLALWCVDALVQAATGVSLGGAAQADRLSGIFGDGNLKLGGVVAVLSPFLVLWAWRDGDRSSRSDPARMLLVLAMLVAVVLLAGARAAWIAMAIALACVAWRRLGARRGALAVIAFVLLAVAGAFVANTLSPRFAERMTRTAAALQGDPAAIDYALSFRLPIFRTALHMAAAHPVNGVGVRAFRAAYDDYAAPGDHWLDPDHGNGALHAHQWLLEVLSETGVPGLLAWFAGIALAVRAWWRASPAARERAAAPAYALVALLFPLNTHYAMYSSFWALLLFAMLALWIGALHAREEMA